MSKPSPKFYIGIDISKLTLDVAVLKNDALLHTCKIANSETAVKDLLDQLKSEFQCTPANTVYCAEYMGMYGKFLQDVLVKKKGRLCLEAPLQIKLSLGIQRGKSDTVDSIRIAQYAKRNGDTLKFWRPPRQCLVKIKSLSSIRKKLIKMKGMLENTKTMETHFLSAKECRAIGAYTQSTYVAIKENIKMIDEEIASTIKNDSLLSQLIKIIISVPCIGKVIATEIIIRTNEFKDISSAKRFCSYCGVAPFERVSGTSLKKKPRVSYFANKDMKKFMHLAALNSTKGRSNKFREYYLRKVKEGKNKMSVLNAIRNKLIHVVFACVRENKQFEEPA